MEKEELRKKRARSLSVPAPDLPGALSQSIVPVQVPARDRSELMATLIENGGTVAGSSNRFRPFGMKRPAVVSVTRSVGARYGLRGTRVGEASNLVERPRVPSRRVVLVPHSPEGTPQSVQDIDVAQSSTEVDLDDLIPTAVEGSDTDSVADALERDVVVDADFVKRSADEDVMSEAGSAVEEETTPHFLRGPFRNALRLAMEEAVRVGEVKLDSTKRDADACHPTLGWFGSASSAFGGTTISLTLPKGAQRIRLQPDSQHSG